MDYLNGFNGDCRAILRDSRSRCVVRRILCYGALIAIRRSVVVLFSVALNSLLNIVFTQLIIPAVS